MRLQYGGIHKNVGFIVQHTGGYDKQYHITRVSEKLNIDRDIIKTIFKEALSSNIDRYVELLEQGASIESIFKLIDADDKLWRAKMTAIAAPMLSLVSNSVYNNLF